MNLKGVLGELTPKHRSMIVLALAAASLVPSSHPARAADTEWIQPSGGMFHNSANWSAGVPGPADRALFLLPNRNYTVEFSSDAVSAGLVFKESSVYFDLGPTPGQPHTYSIPGFATNIVIGESAGDFATVTLQNGSLRAPQGFASIGHAPGAVGDLRVVGGGANPTFFAIDEALTVGLEGVGTLSIRDGGFVRSGGGGVGLLHGSTGTVHVEGAESRWEIAAQLEVGHFGTGFLVIRDGGVVRVAPSGSQSSIGREPGSVGFVAVDGPNSRLETTNPLFVGTSVDPLGGGAGSIHLTNGGSISATGTLIAMKGSINGDGTVSSDVENYGAIRPGSAAGIVGILTIDGHYDQFAEGWLFIDLDGNTPGSSHDQLRISGDASLAGTLMVSLAMGYEPSAGDSYKIVAADTLRRAFDTLHLPPLVPGLMWVADYTPDAVWLRVTKDHGEPQSKSIGQQVDPIRMQRVRRR